LRPDHPLLLVPPTVQGVGIVTKIAIPLVIACSGLLALAAGQSQQSDIRPCAQSPDDASSYPDNMVRPRYPKAALRSGIEGKVELRAVIAPDGKWRDLAVLSGDPEFSHNAITAIRRWRFHPELRHGQPVETIYKIHVRFNLLLQEANSDVELESPLPDAPPISALAKRHRQDLGLEVHRLSEPGMVAPKQLYSPEPEFSEKARIEARQGNVDIDLVVGADGLPRDLEIACSSSPDLNDNAISAVKQWKFAPATKDGTPVPAEIRIEISFKLNSNH
jgi:TonB family protein